MSTFVCISLLLYPFTPQSDQLLKGPLTPVVGQARPQPTEIIAMAKVGRLESNRSLESLLDMDKLGAAGKNAVPLAPRKTVPGHGLEFSSLSYSVIKKQKKDGHWIKKEAYLLNDISGQAVKGEIMAIMGPSGAGKSTFLDALAGRIAQGSLQGSVQIDGKPVLILLFYLLLIRCPTTIQLR